MFDHSIKVTIATCIAMAMAIAANAEPTISWFGTENATSVTTALGNSGASGKGGTWSVTSGTLSAKLSAADTKVTIATDADEDDVPVVYEPTSSLLADAEDEVTILLDDVTFINNNTSTTLDDGTRAAIKLVKGTGDNDSSKYYFAVANGGSWTETSVEASRSTAYDIKIVLKYGNSSSTVDYYYKDNTAESYTALLDESATGIAKGENTPVTTFSGNGTFVAFNGNYIGQAYIGNTAYANVDDAVKAAGENDAVILQKSVTWTPSYNNITKNIAFTNGTHNLTIVDSSYNSIGYSCKLNDNVLYLHVLPFSGGNGTESSPYEIADAKTFKTFANGVTAKSYGNYSSGTKTYYEQTANIDLDNEAFGGIGIGTSVPFGGIYNGNGYVVTNVVFSRGKYRALFNYTKGATVSNLVVCLGKGDMLKDKSTNDIAYTAFDLDGYECATPSEFGGSAIVGYAESSDFVYCAAYGQIAGTHSVAGIAVKLLAGASFVCCTNHVNVIGTNTKMGGVAVFTQVTGLTMDRCVNYGNVSARGASSCLVVDAEHPNETVGCDGVGGIIGFISQNMTFNSCENYGILTAETTYNGSRYNLSYSPTNRLGGIVGLAYNPSTTNVTPIFTGENIIRNDQLAVGCAAAISPTNSCFALVNGDYATIVTNSSLVAKTLSPNISPNTYKFVAPTPYTIAYQYDGLNEVGKSIIIDRSLYTNFTFNVSLPFGLKLSKSTEYYVDTLTAASYTPTLIIIK